MDSSIKGWLKGTKQGTEFFSDFYYFSDLLTKMKKIKFFQEIKNSTMLHKIFETYFVGNKAKERISKRVFQKNKARQILCISPYSVRMLENNVYISGGKKCLSFRKFDVFCFLETPVWRFTLLPYYRRIYEIEWDRTFYVKFNNWYFFKFSSAIAHFYFWREIGS